LEIEKQIKKALIKIIIQAIEQPADRQDMLEESNSRNELVFVYNIENCK